MKTKPYRCRGSYARGTACANVDLPEGVESCARCTERGYDETKRTAARKAEEERTKDLPADRVKRGQTVIIKNDNPGANNTPNPNQ